MPAILKLLRWRDRAPWWYDPGLGAAMALTSVGSRHIVVGYGDELIYALFFPFVTLASLIGRAAMGATFVLLTVGYIRFVITYRADSSPYLHVGAYVLSAGAIIAIGNILMRVVMVSEADRQRAQATESYLASLVRSSNDAIITKSLDGVVTSWNLAAQRLLGFEAHEAVGSPVALIIPPDRLEEETGILRKLSRGEVIEQYVTVRVTKSGERVDVSLTISPIYAECGRIVGVSTILRDVTKAKQAADALRESEERLRCAVEGAKAGAWQRDFVTGASDWSQRFCEMHGVAGQPTDPALPLWLERILPEDREPAMRDLQQALEGGGADYHSHYRVVTHAGEMRWIEIFGYIERLPDGAPRRISGISLDSTESRRAMEALTELNENLRWANESLRRFSSIAAHDLQEPLRKIEQFSDLLREEYADRMDGDGGFYLTVMRESARRMRALINALLSFSRAGARPLSIARVDMNDVIDKVLGDYALTIQETGARIEVDALPALHGDPDLVGQLFQNLISNALKYAKCGEPPRIRVVGWTQGTVASIAVRDEGIGIAGEHHQLIFEPFTRLNPRETVKGTGIGLAFCRTVCERHGWTLGVASQLGQGAEFTVAAPRSEGVLAA